MAEEWDGMVIELADCQNTLLAEIANPVFRRKDVAQTYSLAMRSSECSLIDWKVVNAAIISRWSRSALEWIKKQAHSGKCFETTTAPAVSDAGRG
jgi:hypothetical protein